VATAVYVGLSRKRVADTLLITSLATVLALAACAGPISQPTPIPEPARLTLPTATLAPEANLPPTLPPPSTPTGSPSATQSPVGIAAENAAEVVAVHTLEGHAGDVNSVAFSPDGSLLAMAGNRCFLELRQGESGILQRTLRQPGCTTGAGGWATGWGLAADPPPEGQRQPDHPTPRG